MPSLVVVLVSFEGLILRKTLIVDRNHVLTDTKRNWQPVLNAEIVPGTFEEYFSMVDSWGWSAVLASSLVAGCPLRWTMFGLWKKYEFFSLFGIEQNTFFNFADRLERSYGKVRLEVR